MFSKRRAALSPMSKRHCDDIQADKKEHRSKEKPRSNDETDEHRGEDENTYVVDRTVQHDGYGPSLRYVVR